MTKRNHIPPDLRPDEENSSKNYDSSTYLMIREIINRETEFIRRGMENVNFIMGVIIVVLFLGFVATFLAVISILIQWWGFNANIQSDLTKSINNEANMINDLNRDIRNLKQSLKEQQASSSGY